MSSRLLVACLRLTGLACEVGGRWSSFCLHIVRQLAAAEARTAPTFLCSSVAQAWRARWWALLSVVAKSAFAATLTGKGLASLDGCDGPGPALAGILADAPGPPPISRLPLRG